MLGERVGWPLMAGTNKKVILKLNLHSKQIQGEGMDVAEL